MNSTQYINEVDRQCMTVDPQVIVVSFLGKPQKSYLTSGPTTYIHIPPPLDLSGYPILELKKSVFFLVYGL